MKFKQFLKLYQKKIPIFAILIIIFVLILLLLLQTFGLFSINTDKSRNDFWATIIIGPVALVLIITIIIFLYYYYQDER